MTWDVKDGVNYTGMNPEGEAILKKEDKPLKEEKESPTGNLIDELSGKKMQELQEFGTKYGVKDNIKSELIEKILDKVPDDDIIKFLEVN